MQLLDRSQSKVLCTMLAVTVLVTSTPLVPRGYGQEPSVAASPAHQNSPAMAPGPPPGEATPEELEQLVSPIALYPDLLVARILVASTFPDQIVEAHKWLQENSGLKGKEFASDVRAKPWDPSVRSLSQFPEVIKTMNDNLAWTSDLGEAYYNQPDEVMNAIQRLRKRAVDAGTLKDTPQQKVETQSPPVQAPQGTTTVEGGAAPAAQQQVVVIQPAQPETVYVPQYNPATAYGAPVQAPAGYTGTEMLTTGLLSFGLGMGLGALISEDDDDDWDCGWSGGGGNTNNINYNKNVYRNRGDTFPNAQPRQASRQARREARNPASTPSPRRAARGPTARPYNAASAKPFRGGGPGAGQPVFPKASALPANASLGTTQPGAGRGAVQNRPSTVANNARGTNRPGSVGGQGMSSARGFSPTAGSRSARGGPSGAFGGYEPGGMAQAAGNRGRSSLLGGGGGRGGRGFGGGGGGRGGGGRGRGGGGGGGRGRR